MGGGQFRDQEYQLIKQHRPMEAEPAQENSLEALLIFVLRPTRKITLEACPGRLEGTQESSALTHAPSVSLEVFLKKPSLKS